jgi:antitoxin HicB
MRHVMIKLEYAVVIEPDAEAGGFIATAPELPGCMSDGETPEAALASIEGAISEWIDEAQRLGRAVPAPRHNVAA